MSAYLPPKLTNPENFSSEGIVDCSINLIALEENLSINFLEEKQCDIIFTGNFLLDGDLSQSSLSEDVLNTIYGWSTRSETNLVITSQAEAKTWGYIIDDFNVNPNVSSGDILGENIFDGAFGTVNAFYQGGTFQGIIEEGPTTGFKVLSWDANNKPTIVLDNYTNDLILGDIGIFCGGAAGELTNGPIITNDNDILLGNIFALGCQLTFTTFLEDEINLCDGESYSLASDLEVFESGNYLDTIKNINGCDSIIINAQVTFSNNSNAEINYLGYSGDGYSVQVGEDLYDENNPEGITVLENEAGCDSTTTIRLVFNENEIYIPNTFNPNATDLVNNSFTAYSEENGLIKSMQIYDRWGNKIFESKNLTTNDPTLGWKGRMNGNDVSPGVYVYHFEIALSEDKSLVKNGTVTLLR